MLEVVALKISAVPTTTRIKPAALRQSAEAIAQNQLSPKLVLGYAT